MTAPKRKLVTNPFDRRRRRHTRHRSEFRVSVSHLASQYQQIEGHCRDISEAGIGLLLAADMSCGEVVSLSFILPGSTALWEIRAVVRYRRGYHYGFEFLSLAPEQQESLKTYLKTLEAME